MLYRGQEQCAPEQVNFPVRHQTHSPFMKNNDVGPNIVADQFTHSADINLTVYT